MKSTIKILLSLSLLIFLASCGDDDPVGSSSGSNPSSSFEQYNGSIAVVGENSTLLDSETLESLPNIGVHNIDNLTDKILHDTSNDNLCRALNYLLEKNGLQPYQLPIENPREIYETILSFDFAWLDEIIESNREILINRNLAETQNSDIKYIIRTVGNADNGVTIEVFADNTNQKTREEILADVTLSMYSFCF
jgi:hypothetical protein